MTWLPTFLFLFALGTAAAIATVPFRQIGKYYFKFHSTLALVFVVAAVLLGKPWAAFYGSGPGAKVAALAAFVFAGVLFLENVIVRAAKETLRVDALLMPVSIGVFFVGVTAFAGRESAPGAALLLTAHLLSSAAVLGSALVAMTTGHWYLANAKLPFEILIRLSRFLVIAVAVKGLVSAIYVATRFADYGRLEDFDKLMIGLRLLAGVVLAFVLALMALSCARRKANQSATGILYVAVVFVLIGEAVSMALTFGYQRPV